MKWQGGGALWINTLTLGTGADAAKVVGIGTALKIYVLGNVVLEKPIGSSDSKVEYNQYKFSHGVTMETEKRTITVDGAGVVKAASGDASLHKVTIDIAGTNLAAIHAINALENSAGGGLLLLTIPLGDKNEEGFAYIIAKITGTMKIELGENAVKPIQCIFNGLTTAVEATEDLTHTAINTAITSMTQIGLGVALHPATAGTTYAIEADDIDAEKLLSGKFLFKPAAA